MIISSSPCTFNRYCALITSHLSQLRFFQYEKLSGVFLPGQAVDIGGRENTSYRPLFRTESKMLTLNLSIETWGGGVDIIADCNEPLPLEDNQFDSLLCANTLEHVKNDELALREAMRILKAGGHFHILIPFLYREHGAPSDFHRHTAQWWNDFFLTLGLQDDQFTVEPLVWDEFATGSSFFECFGRRFGRFIMPFVRMLFCFPGLLTNFFGMRKNRTFIDTNALGFYISGVK